MNIPFAEIPTTKPAHPHRRSRSQEPGQHDQPGSYEEALKLPPAISQEKNNRFPFVVPIKKSQIWQSELTSPKQGIPNQVP